MKILGYHRQGQVLKGMWKKYRGKEKDERESDKNSERDCAHKSEQEKRQKLYHHHSVSAPVGSINRSSNLSRKKEKPFCCCCKQRFRQQHKTPIPGQAASIKNISVLTALQEPLVLMHISLPAPGYFQPTAKTAGSPKPSSHPQHILVYGNCFSLSLSRQSQ